MIVTRHADQLTKLPRLRAVIEGAQAASLHPICRQGAHACIADTLPALSLSAPGHGRPGLGTRYLCLITGLSRPQRVWPIAQHREARRIRARGHRLLPPSALSPD